MESFLTSGLATIMATDNEFQVNEMNIAISLEITELVEKILGIDGDAGKVLHKHTLIEIDRVAKTIGDIATSHLCE